jgi:hypothetical protein
MALRISLYAAAALLLAAHFLRARDHVLVALCLAAPLLFLWRTRWSLVLLQLMAYAAAVTWTIVAIRLIQLRQSLGQPWTLAAVILGGVVLFTLLAGLLLNSRPMRHRYPG